MNPDRLESDLRGMADVGISQMIVSDPAAISYLTGTWIHPGERMPALRLSLTGRHALFVNEWISSSGNAEARRRKGKREIGRGGDRTAAGG